MKTEKPNLHNYVAKNMVRCGSGRHSEKNGKNAKRSRQKRDWKKTINENLR